MEHQFSEGIESDIGYKAFVPPSARLDFDEPEPNEDDDDDLFDVYENPGEVIEHELG